MSEELLQIREQWLPVIPLPADASLEGKTAIVVGASSGLGFATAQHLATLKPAKLILTGRTSSRMAGAYDAVMDANDARNVVPWQLDLNSNDSILRFVERVTKHGRLDLLILNAGVNMPTWKEEQGHELNLQTNVYGTFSVLLLLLPLLKASNGRCLVVTSASYSFIPNPPSYLVLGELDSKERTHAAARSSDPATRALSMPNRYMLSKMLQIMLVRAIAEKTEGVSVCAVNPGMANTSLFRHLPYLMSTAVWAIGMVAARKTTEAAKVLLYPAFLPQDAAVHGHYFSNCKEYPVSAFLESEAGQALGRNLLEQLIKSLNKVDRRVGKALQ